MTENEIAAQMVDAAYADAHRILVSTRSSGQNRRREVKYDHGAC